MTALLAIVGSIEEARSAASAGADRVALAAGAGWSGAGAMRLDDGSAVPMGLLIAEAQAAPDPLALVRDVMAARHGAIWLPLAPAWNAAIRHVVAAGLETIGVVAPERSLDEGLCGEATALGLHAILVAEPPFTGRRLLDHRSIAALSAGVALCHARGLRVALAGAIEPPDIPRLLVLSPDELGLDTLLRDPAGRFDSTRLPEARAAMKAPPDAAVSAGAGGERDFILVRDWIVKMSIGAYARERGQVQRVRFGVEAEIAPAGRRLDGMTGVVSYDLITDAIARCTSGHVDLVESLAEEVAASVLRHPRVLGVEITVEKLDVGPGTVGCRLVRRRAP